MNRLPIEKRAQIIGLLVEGMSMRAVTRITGVSINTVTKRWRTLAWLPACTKPR